MAPLHANVFHGESASEIKREQSYNSTIVNPEKSVIQIRLHFQEHMKLIA